MPCYRFLIQGHDIETHTGCIGFFTNRTARAPNMGAARTRVLSRLAQEWSTGSGASPDKQPRFEVVTSKEISLTQYVLRGRGAGHTFYEDADAVASALEIEMEAADLSLLDRKHSTLDS